jgi:simple sugar transport system permease protein
MKQKLLPLAYALLTSFVILSVGLLLCGYSPITFTKVIIQSTWLSPRDILTVLNKASLFILTGLAVVIPYRAGLFNIGGEGQMYIGAITAAVIGTLPLAFLGKLHLVICVLAAILASCIWAWFAAWLRSARGVHEVISTILLNFTAFYLVNELTFQWLLAEPGSSRTAFVLPSAELPVLAEFRAASLTSGIICSMMIALLFSVLLYFTWHGFAIRSVGENPEASEYSGIHVSKIQQLAMILGGACAGMAGAIESLGINKTFYARFDGGTGFDGIAVAFLALCEPWAVIPSALFLATVRSADRALQLEMNIPKEIVFVVEAVFVISIAIWFKKSKSQV